ncbi:MAG: UxaA family hydrolase [Acidobacteria bacterium]|nr:UxaA family hydrolase [Acidobacteriota bacterium]
MIADQFRGPVLDAYATVDEVAALTQSSGCEMLQSQRFLDQDDPAKIIEQVAIQGTGGIRATVKAGVELITGMLPAIVQLERKEMDVSALVLGLNCGGSEGYSGVSANPALGVASDLLVAYGGTNMRASLWMVR